MSLKYKPPNNVTIQPVCNCFVKSRNCLGFKIALGTWFICEVQTVKKGECWTNMKKLDQQKKAVVWQEEVIRVAAGIRRRVLDHTIRNNGGESEPAWYS